MNAKDLFIDIYEKYGFTLARSSDDDQILVFTINYACFHNAEIVKLNKSANHDQILSEFTQSGYGCTVRSANSPEEAEEHLFNAFFAAESSRKKIKNNYENFTSNILKYSENEATYEYINAPYQVNGIDGLSSAPNEVISRIDSNEPTLFLIEAAAGFGKTCTAQEISKMLVHSTTKLPLYAELSRNRQARIFRYILLDEIDQSFPLLNASLVQEQIRNGKIPVILDGFDELLRKSEEGDGFDKKEPMLETIANLLTKKSKIIITTRRTILFDWDDFHQWLQRNSEKFSFVRIRIQEPEINNWLSTEKIELLERHSLNLRDIANPVLLSYLRCLSDDSFISISHNAEDIVDSYFTHLLERERQRQDLNMTPTTQNEIFQKVAADMASHGYTAEDRSYVINLFLCTCNKEIEETRYKYSGEERPTPEEIANKLASHALFDRSSHDDSKIGFVNEFALGNYIARDVISSEDWLGDDMRFIDPAVKSYIPRMLESKNRLFNGLKDSLDYISTRHKIEITAQLIGELPETLENTSADGVDISSVDIGRSPIVNCQFSDSTFKRCRFIKKNLIKVSFINCKFFECEVIDDDHEIHNMNYIYVLGGLISSETKDLLTLTPSDREYDIEIDRDKIIRCSLIRKFWPSGDNISQRPSRPVFKPAKHLCQPFDDFDSHEIFSILQDLLKEGILIEMSKSNLITLNIENAEQASDILVAGE